MSAETAVLEWRRAQASLGAADACRRDGYYADAVSRAYYAVLHAARAALELQGFTTETHRATRIMFGQYVVKTGRVESGWSRVISEMANARADADYKVKLTFDVDDANVAYVRAEAFLNRIHTLLATVIPAEELG